MGLNSVRVADLEDSRGVNVLTRRTECRVVAEAHDRVFYEITAIEFSLKFGASEHLIIDETDPASLKSVLSHQKKTLARIEAHIKDEFKLSNLSELRAFLVSLDALIEIHDNTNAELASVKQALELLIDGNHFKTDDEDEDLGRSDFNDEINRLESVVQEIQQKLLKMLV